MHSPSLLIPTAAFGLPYFHFNTFFFFSPPEQLKCRGWGESEGLVHAAGTAGSARIWDWEYLSGSDPWPLQGSCWEDFGQHIPEVASQTFKQTPSQPSLSFDHIPTPHVIWIKENKKKKCMTAYLLIPFLPEL